MTSTRCKFRMNGPAAKMHRTRLIGEGDTLIVFSHGLGTDQSIWNPVIDSLPDGYCALVYDLAGASPRLGEGFNPRNYRSISAYADDLLTLLDEIGVEDCIFVGHSVSGMVGLLAAIEEPFRFERLVLINASPRYLNDASYVGGFDPEDLEALFDAMSNNYQAWVAGFAPRVVSVDMPSAVATFSAGLMAMRPDVTINVARTIFYSDLRALLPQVAVPVVLIHSRSDIAVPPEVASYMHGCIPGSDLVWIEADGHLPHLSAPSEVARALWSHLG